MPAIVSDILATLNDNSLHGGDMNRLRILVPAFLCLTAVTPALFFPKHNKRSEVRWYVQQAAEVVREHGPQCETFANSQWRSGDYYIFVVGPDDRLVCHANAEMVGKLSADIVNARGDRVGEEIIRRGAGDKKGWLEYMWARPGKKNEERKSTYVMGVTGPDGKHYVVGAGGWGLRK